MVADLHAITMPYDQDALKQATREIAAAYIAAGVDPDKASLFVQSSVAEHSQLMWLLATMSQMGKLERMTQFKDKAGKDAERAGLGLFSYPVLMAADVLLYQATDVPVGMTRNSILNWPVILRAPITMTQNFSHCLNR